MSAAGRMSVENQLNRVEDPYSTSTAPECAEGDKSDNDEAAPSQLPGLDILSNGSNGYADVDSEANGKHLKYAQNNKLLLMKLGSDCRQRGLFSCSSDVYMKQSSLGH